jgi:TonB-linked SusC/RagA family outer membrane protein
MMRIVCLLALIGFHWLNAANTYSQNALLSLDVKNVKMKEALRQIENGSEFIFFYSNEIDVEQSVTLKVDNQTIDQIMNRLLKNTGYSYTVDDRQIFIKKEDSSWQNRMGSETGKSQQRKNITGRVTDVSGEPIIGANVVVKETLHGTTTDENGRFALNVSEGDLLRISYIGFLAYEVKVENQQTLDITLQEDAQNLDEVVVVGYGTMRKSDLTGSVSSANLDAFQESQNVSIAQSLKGSIPGLQVSQTNRAGQDASLQIRGVNSLSGGTSPLIVVDEIIYTGGLSDLNPNDIKSIDILKDASSKAIYGSQAANGVILITTNSGRIQDKPALSYSGSVSFQHPTKDYRLLNAEENMGKIKGIYYDKAYLGPNYTQINPEWSWNQTELVPNLLTGIENGVDFDWWNALTSTGITTNHSLSLSGGTNRTGYYLSGGYTKVNGFILNDDYERYTIRVNLRNQFKHWLTIGVNTFASFADFSGVSPSYGNIAMTSPFVTPYDSEGELEIYPKGASTTHLNPFLDVRTDDKDIHSRISGIFYTEVKIPWVEGLKYKLNYNQSYAWTDTGSSSIYGAGLTGSAGKGHTSFREETLDHILSYENGLNDHIVSGTLVYGFRKANYGNMYANGQQYANLSLSYHSLQQAIIQQISSDAWKERQLYQMARLNYNYKRRYLLTGTVRRDGYSGFSRNNKFGIFPSVAAGWTLSNEPFFKVKAVDNLKLRISYGENGNQTSRYSSLARVSATEDYKYVFGDGNGTSIGQAITSLANTNLQWEKTVGMNYGLDFAILDNKIRGSLEYYSTKTNDLLWDRIIPEITGFSTIRSNIGEIKNAGFEVNIQASPVTTKDFMWDFNVNFSANKNKVTHLLGDIDGDGKEDDLVSSNLFIGKSISTVYHYKVNGIYQLNDNIPTGYNPGNYRIVEMDGVEGITADDRTFLGRTDPAYTIGFQNNLIYKNFSFRFFLHTIRGGKDGYLGAQSFTMYNSTGNAANANQFTYYDDWSVTNPGAKYAVNYKSPQIIATQYCSRSFLRLQDISLAYQPDKSLVSRLGIEALKIYVSGKNLFTITNWDGWDPETSQGIGSGDPYPVMRSFNIGLDITF